jgi:hypothetical protein
MGTMICLIGPRSRESSTLPDLHRQQRWLTQLEGGKNAQSDQRTGLLR